MNSQKEQFLLYRIRTHKDQHAFGQLYAEKRDYLRRFLALKLPSVADADDALSTTFIRAWNYLTSVPQVEHINALLLTIAKGVVAEFYRRRKVTVSYDDDTDMQEQLTDGGKAQKDILATAEVELVRRALAEMPEDQSTAITLRYLSGLPVAEVAEQIGKSTNATQVMLHRALKSLRGKLER